MVGAAGRGRGRGRAVMPSFPGNWRVEPSSFAFGQPTISEAMVGAAGPGRGRAVNVMPFFPGNCIRRVQPPGTSDQAAARRVHQEEIVKKKRRILEEELVKMKEKQRILEGELVKMKGMLECEQQSKNSVNAQGDPQLERLALKALAIGRRSYLCANLNESIRPAGEEVQEGLAAGEEGFESEEEDEDEEGFEMDEDEELVQGGERSLKALDSKKLREELGVPTGFYSAYHRILFKCMDDEIVPACPALLAAASPLLKKMIAREMVVAASVHEIRRYLIPLPQLRSAGLVYILHCLQGLQTGDMQQIQVQLSPGLCCEVLNAAKLFQVKELDRLALQATFDECKDVVKLVESLLLIRMHPGKDLPPEHLKMGAYVRERLRKVIEAQDGPKFLEWRLLMLLSFVDFYDVHLHGDIRFFVTCDSAWAMAAWSSFLKNSQYGCLHDYKRLRDILVWAAFQVSKEAAHMLHNYLPSCIRYCDYIADCPPSQQEAQAALIEDRREDDPEDQSLSKLFPDSPPKPLSELTGALKDVRAFLDKYWKWPWGTLECIHPEILVCWIKPLGIIDERRLKQALAWQVLHEPKSISVKEGKLEFQFNLHLYKLLQLLHPGTTISLDAMALVSTFLQAVSEKLLQEAARIAKVNKRTARASKPSIISWKNIERAVKLFLPPTLAEHAVQKGEEAVRRYFAAEKEGEVLSG